MEAKERALVEQVIAVYEKELLELDEALKAYIAKAHRKALLEDTIGRLKMSIGEEPKKRPMPKVANPVQPQTDPLWKGIRQILLDLKRPAKAPEIARMLTQRGWKMTENAREITRSTMARKPDTFKALGGGMYGLVTPE